MGMGLSQNSFDETMCGFPELAAGGVVAVGVSGGPDSMAMLWLLSQWAKPRNISLHAYTVDHGLRADSADEAARVGAWVGKWPQVSHRILQWDGDKPGSRILEEARGARYGLMVEAMQAAGAKYLFIAHHRDDQAETFLIRLAKGSGLDGLAAMRPVQPMGGGIVVLRPLLDVSKDDLVRICTENNIPHVDDPTNKNQKYLRPRLRAAQDILEEEGLSSKRLGATARRLARASSALEDFAHDLFSLALIEKRDDGFLFDYKALHAAHEELVLRVLLHAMDEIHPEGEYGPRLEKVENLLERILRDAAFRGATLGGCIFAKDAKDETLWIGRE